MHVLYRLNLVCVSITNLFKKRLRHSCLPVNFSKDLKTTIIQNTSNGLFLIVSHFSSDISSRPEVFYKNSNLENFAKFTRNHLCQNFVFSKVASILLKKRLWHRCFSVNFAKFLRTPFFIERSHRNTVTGDCFSSELIKSERKVFFELSIKDFDFVTLREEFPNTELFLVSIFLYSD